MVMIIDTLWVTVRRRECKIDISMSNAGLTWTYIARTFITGGGEHDDITVSRGGRTKQSATKHLMDAVRIMLKGRQEPEAHPTIW